MTEKNKRDERLAMQLRENLKKRKARARGVAGNVAPAGPSLTDQQR